MEMSDSMIPINWRTPVDSRRPMSLGAVSAVAASLEMGSLYDV
jgi:hypothetical protein